MFSSFLEELSNHARITILTTVDHPDLFEKSRNFVAGFDKLAPVENTGLVRIIRTIVENAHEKWTGSKAAQNYWAIRDYRARKSNTRLKRNLLKLIAALVGNRAVLRFLTNLENLLSLQRVEAKRFRDYFLKTKPDLVFNTSHVHGTAGELPSKVSQSLGIPTAGFIFSWDNLTSRSRIFVPYDHYLVWNKAMKNELCQIYDFVHESNVHVVGTPQFDFHHDREQYWSREELCEVMGLNPNLPYVLYTTGMDIHFFEEHKHVTTVIKHLEDKYSANVQLVVRTYVKGTSQEMMRLKDAMYPNVFFPTPAWNKDYLMPEYEDIKQYTNLLRHAALGINAASTVSLELISLGVPVININYNPEGFSLPEIFGYSRHINYDHYAPVAASGAVFVANSNEELRAMIDISITDRNCLEKAQKRFIERFFDGRLDYKFASQSASALVNILKINQ